jgi:hypothetical protein
MFDHLKARWNAAKRRRFQERVASHLRQHFSEVMGPDERLLDEPDGIDRLYEKYFGGASS